MKKTMDKEYIEQQRKAAGKSILTAMNNINELVIYLSDKASLEIISDLMYSINLLVQANNYFNKAIKKLLENE
jgi:hypothetical protein